jgi:thiazole synthase ThiGH ThiG subunit
VLGHHRPGLSHEFQEFSVVGDNVFSNEISRHCASPVPAESKLAKYLGHDQIETLPNHAGCSSTDQGGGKRRAVNF